MLYIYVVFNTSPFADPRYGKLVYLNFYLVNLNLPTLGWLFLICCLMNNLSQHVHFYNCLVNWTRVPIWLKSNLPKANQSGLLLILAYQVTT